MDHVTSTCRIRLAVLDVMRLDGDGPEFLRTRNHRLYAAFVVMLVLGLRCGELLGLRWADLDWDRGDPAALAGTAGSPRWQVQRVRGKLTLVELKTKVSRGDVTAAADLFRSAVRTTDHAGS